MNELLRILEELHPEIDFSSHRTLIDDGVLDSFDIITLVAEIDDAFGVAIPAAALIPENFNSADALHALILHLQA